MTGLVGNVPALSACRLDIANAQGCYTDKDSLIEITGWCGGGIKDKCTSLATCGPHLLLIGLYIEHDSL